MTKVDTTKVLSFLNCAARIRLFTVNWLYAGEAAVKYVSGRNNLKSALRNTDGNGTGSPEKNLPRTFFIISICCNILTSSFFRFSFIYKYEEER
jgi:hypothetical protein